MGFNIIAYYRSIFNRIEANTIYRVPPTKRYTLGNAFFACSSAFACPK
jgi:hypothetical protein